MTSPSTTVPRTEERWSALQWGTLLVLCAALFLDALDVSMVGVALPSIGHDLHLSTSSLQWVVSGYVLGYGGLLLLGGRAADLLGRRRVFLIALAVFAVASLLGGLVDSGELLIATRFIKGLSAAFTAPAGLSIITTTFTEGPIRNRALTIYSSCGATGFSMGLVLSGFLTEAGWRWTMLLPAPVALIALIAGLKLIPKTPRERHEGRGYDLPGAVTGTGAMLLLVFTVVSATSAGWASARTLARSSGSRRCSPPSSSSNSGRPTR
jgi:MFS family permease